MNTKIPLIVLLALLLTSLTLSVPIAWAQPPSTWTVMVYLDADNNLDPAGVTDVAEMQAVGSTDHVNIVVLFDRSSARCGYNGSKILHIHAGGNTTLWGSWTDADECNMGDPATLTWFLNFTVAAFPADRYALVLWDHGGNWEGICWDDTDDDYLTITEVRTALADAAVDTVDVLGFDACLMASLEVAYTIRLTGKVDVLVASEDSIPWDGWPYDTVLTALTAHPAWTPQDFAADIVDEYVAAYAHAPLSRAYITLSALDLAALDPLIEDVATLADELLTHFDAYAHAFTSSMNRADRYWYGMWHHGPYIDFRQFISTLGDADSALTPYTSPILTQMDSLVIASHCWPGPHTRGATGLTVYCPRNRNQFYTPEPYYASIADFADAAHWHTLLVTYFGQ